MTKKQKEREKYVVETLAGLRRARTLLRRGRGLGDILGLVSRASRALKILSDPKRKAPERSMKCVCGKKFKGFSTWYPHWKSRHPILHRRYSEVKGQKGASGRANLMLRLMRAASA